MIERLRRWYGLAVIVFDSLGSPLLLALRLYIGWQFFQAGLGKLQHLDRFTEFLTNLGVPLPGLNAPFVAALECVGGLLLLVGLASRLIALPLLINMIVAFITADRDALIHVFSNPDGFTAATPFLYLLVCLIVLAFGPGLFSLDAILDRFFFQPRKPLEPAPAQL